MIKKRLIRLLGSSVRYIVLQVLFQWMSLLCQIGWIFLAAGLFEHQIMDHQPVRSDRIALAGVLFLIRILLDRLSANASGNASSNVKKTLREKIYLKLLRLGFSYREHVSTSSVVQMAVEGVDQLETYFGKYLAQFFYSMLAPLTLYIVLSFVNRKAALVLLLSVPLIPISIVLVQKFAGRLLKRYWGVYTSLGDHFLENLQGLTTLKIYGADQLKADQMDREAEHFRRITMRVLTMQLNSTSVMDIMAYGGAAAGMIVILSEYAKGNVTLAGALTVVLLSSDFFIPLRLLGSFFHVAMNGMAASDRIFELLDLPEPDEKTGVLDDSPVGFEMEHVSFSYEPERPILSDVHLNIQPHSFVGLVGLSGSGKSTIASLLCGHNQSYKGSVRIQGKSIRDIKESELVRTITYIGNESYLFKGTVESILRMARPDASKERMIHVLREVSLWGFLEKQGGLQFLLQERGSNLSGGQRQRLALARAILKDTPVYLFDEATSNIDLESEELIMKLIHRMAKEKTVILISHRLANVVNADQILYLSDGQIKERGTHAELISRQGEYATLYNRQKDLEAVSNADSIAAMKIPEQDYVPEVQAEPDISRRSGWKIMGSLIGLVRPLLPLMVTAVLLGVIGFLCAGYLIIGGASALMDRTVFGLSVTGSLLLVPAVMRGVLHYGEQYCNHFIAFKLLALIRHHVFDRMRKLAPAKIEGKDRGNLVAVITSDIELLEVFYAHTISPIFIALITSLFMVCWIARISWAGALIAITGYVLVGIVIPLYMGKKGGRTGSEYRQRTGALNSFVLENLRGLNEIMQFGADRSRLDQLNEQSDRFSLLQKQLVKLDGEQRSWTNLVIQLCSLGIILAVIAADLPKGADESGLIVACVALFSSFGPVVALANLSTNLNQTLASGERVLRILEERPQVEEVRNGIVLNGFSSLAADDVCFSYGAEQILRGISLTVMPGEIIGIHGSSGSGKSTFLKLLMRFWDPVSGSIQMNGYPLADIDTSSLRHAESYMTQETMLFDDTIANNIAIAKPGASPEEIEGAARKASLHDFVMRLPQKYDTGVGELGSSLSAGERQRIGLARAFLHDSPVLLLDEPTSSLDALNEGIILKSLLSDAEDRTVLLVSHRLSTMSICDRVMEMNEGRTS